MQGCELVDRDRARLEQPSQAGGQIGNRRFEQDPGACVVHVAQPLMELALDRIGRYSVEERSEVGVRRDLVLAHERRGADDQRRFGGVTADRRERRELFEGAIERNGHRSQGLSMDG